MVLEDRELGLPQMRGEYGYAVGKAHRCIIGGVASGVTLLRNDVTSLRKSVTPAPDPLRNPVTVTKIRNAVTQPVTWPCQTCGQGEPRAKPKTAKDRMRKYRAARKSTRQDQSRPATAYRFDIDDWYAVIDSIKAGK